MFGRSKKGDKAAKKPKAKKEKKPKAKKKAKPARKSKAAGVAVKKRPTDVYTVMLMLSLAFIMIACGLLFMELGSYGFPGTTQPWK